MCLRPAAKHRPYSLLFIALSLLILISSMSLSTKTYADARQNSAAILWELTYQIDRSQVPDLYYNNLTVIVDVGSANSVSVQVDGNMVASTYSASTGIVQFTTRGSNIYLAIDGAQDNNMPAPISKAPLLNNKEWAWSHGFDDNVNLKPAIAAFNAKNWQATLFMITSIIDDTRQQDWIVDKPDLLTHLSQGWGVGSHGKASNCQDANKPDQVDAINRLEGLINDSSIPNYTLISFAVPCFFENSYAPVFLDIMDDGTTNLQFYESGNNYMRLVDPAFVKPHGSSNVPTFSAGQGQAVGLELVGALGRDFSIELSGENGIDSVLEKFDWMAAHSANNRHFWYNTLSHGSNESNITQAINHVYNNYGPNGTNEAWVAPSDRIYSYILVRDNSQISLTSIKKGGVPWSPLTQTATPSPTSTNIAVPTQMNTATFTPTHTATPTATKTATAMPLGTSTATATLVVTSEPATPTGATDQAIYLPLIQR